MPRKALPPHGNAPQLLLGPAVGVPGRPAPPVIDLYPLAATVPPAMSYDGSDSIIPDPFGGAASIPASALQGIGATAVAALANYAQTPLATVQGSIPIVRGRGKNRRESTIETAFFFNNGHLMLLLTFFYGRAVAAGLQELVRRSTTEEPGAADAREKIARLAGIPTKKGLQNVWEWFSQGKLPWDL